MKTLPVEANRFGIFDRYFLRQLAVAHRRSNKPRVQFANALADTILVFVALPIAGPANFIIVLNAKHAAISKQLAAMPRIGLYVLAALAMLVGYFVLKKRMKKHVEEDSTCYLRFGTDKDAEIVFWQRLAAIFIIGILPVFLALMVLGSP